MPILTWNDSYSLNIREIDNHHKELFSIINSVAEAIDQDADDEQFGLIIGKLNDYTIYHFTYEENLFDKHGYKDSDKHKAKHKFFIEKINELSSGYCTNQKNVSSRLLFFLFDWLVSHIQNADVQYVPVVNS